MADALIWGASGGIGAALVRHLKANGWRVFAAARHEDRIPTEADFAYTFDATKPFTVSDVCLRVMQETEALDLTVYAAGSNTAGQLEKLNADDWLTMQAVNLNGAFLTMQGTLSLLKEGGHAMILGAYVDSITLPRMGAYAAAKAGLEPLVKVLQKENRKHKFTLVRPPAVDTPFWENVPFKLPKNAITPDAVAAAILTHYDSGQDGYLDL